MVMGCTGLCRLGRLQQNNVGTGSTYG